MKVTTLIIDLNILSYYRPKAKITHNAVYKKNKSSSNYRIH